MSTSRKDSKGRVLKTGESERKDGLYQYRYTEPGGQRKTIYANNLNDLRKKESEIQKLTELGVSYFEGSMAVTKLLDRYLALKQNLRTNTVRGYGIKYNKSHAIQLPDVTPHILRHTFCTNCINAGMNIKTVQYLMGHATSKMTLDVYTDCNLDKVNDEISLLDCVSY